MGCIDRCSITCRHLLGRRCESSSRSLPPSNRPARNRPPMRLSPSNLTSTSSLTERYCGSKCPRKSLPDHYKSIAITEELQPMSSPPFLFPPRVGISDALAGESLTEHPSPDR